MKHGQRGEENCKKSEKSPNVVFGMEIAIADMAAHVTFCHLFLFFILLIFCHVKLITEK
jgi:hypothetical protein